MHTFLAKKKNTKEINNLEVLGADGSVILKRTLKSRMEGLGLPR
jgi:hypothetical protein